MDTPYLINVECTFWHILCYHCKTYIVKLDQNGKVFPGEGGGSHHFYRGVPPGKRLPLSSLRALSHQWQSEIPTESLRIQWI